MLTSVVTTLTAGIPGSPASVAVVPDGTRAYVLGSTMSIVDVSTLSVVGSGILAAARWARQQGSGSPRTVRRATRFRPANGVASFQTNTNAPTLTTIAVGSGPQSVALARPTTTITPHADTYAVGRTFGLG